MKGSIFNGKSMSHRPCQCDEYGKTSNAKYDALIPSQNNKTAIKRFSTDFVLALKTR